MGGGEGSGSCRKSMVMTIKMPESTPALTSELVRVNNRPRVNVDALPDRA
jgi:hypothetical protein